VNLPNGVNDNVPSYHRASYLQHLLFSLPQRQAYDSSALIVLCSGRRCDCAPRDALDSPARFLTFTEHIGPFAGKARKFAKASISPAVYIDMLAINNLPFSLETIARLPAPPRLPADIASMLADDRAGFSPLAGTCVETAARSERKRDAAQRFAAIQGLIVDSLRGY